MRITAFLFLSFLVKIAASQILQAIPSSIQFANKVLTNTNDSVQLTLTNLGNSAVQVKNIRVFSSEFSVSDTVFSLSPISSKVVWVRFRPNQNVAYNTEMIISTSKGDQVLDVKGSGKFAEAYYDGTFNLFEEALKTELKNRLAQGYITLGYNTARDYMYASIDNVSGNVECVYTGRVASFNTRSGAAANNFNCEHTYPQSQFGSADPMLSDIHHLFPVDETANSTRSNDPWGYVTSPTWSVGGSKSNGSLFEPRDAHKGKGARAQLYFVARYGNLNNFLSSQEIILRQWCKSFPPDAAEKKRNNDIDVVQKNRNPFIDHPEFLDRISSMSTTSSAPVVRKMDYLTQVITANAFVGQNFTWDVAFAGTGNSSVALSNIRFAQNLFSFTSAPNGLFPGESLVLSFAKTPTAAGVIYDTIIFNSNAIGYAELRIPVTLSVSATGIENQVIDPTIFPNPANANLFIQKSSLVLQQRLEVFDAMGKSMIKINSLPNSSITLETANWPAGVYFVIIMDDAGTHNRIISVLH